MLLNLCSKRYGFRGVLGRSLHKLRVVMDLDDCMIQAKITGAKSGSGSGELINKVYQIVIIYNIIRYFCLFGW